MKVLLVEDEEHKTVDLKNRLRVHGVADSDLTFAQSVREAVLAVVTTTFDLVVLDMALPTFSKVRPDEGGGGLAQAVGGVEVLRAMQASGKRAAIIIVTQYPDIILNGEKVKLQNVAKIISQRYEQNVLGGVLYSFNTPKWEAAFDGLLGLLNARRSL
ncbi:response regulator [Rhizobium leguminosarum]|uniref:Response regulator receiver domain protein n=1 Tax=Rhizobium leguminosarum TaxID=384 RepID=A0A2K9ZH10_RHILE|nr:response regulator [Rhizobium leguminosarum]AUW47509.1 Response regulator receiver domain protein [Rhizobium leguminosarum]MBY5571471.1 response regulator [Rhizobium leguminosarum]MBY5577965.1 response regulator [Rhizobium leguminosarum]